MSRSRYLPDLCIGKRGIMNVIDKRKEGKEQK